MSIAKLVRDLLEPSCLSAPFVDAIEKLDDISVSPSLAIREPLARLVVSNPTLLQRNFNRHAVGELATSMTLQGVASGLKVCRLREQLLSHSNDELRHSKMFRALADGLIKFTNVTSDENYDWIIENDRRFLKNYNGDVIAFICDLFAGEVRTYSFLSGYVSAFSGVRSAHGEKSGRILRQVLDDERRHVEYTARYISQWMGDGLDLTAVLVRGFKGFDRVSWVDVAATAEFLSERP